MNKATTIVGAIIIWLLSTLFCYMMIRYSRGSENGSILILVMVFAWLGITAGLIIVVVKSSKENFTLTGDGQTINIFQSCGGNSPPAPQPTPPGPPAPPPAPVSQDDVKNWIKGVDPSLTDDCITCILDNAMHLWTADSLTSVQAMPVEKQLQILKAMLVFNCKQQCVIPANDLLPAAVDHWVRTTKPGLAPQCISCIVKAIIKMWSKDDYSQAVQKPVEDQVKILEALLAFQCKSCQEPASLNPEQIFNWVKTMYPNGANDCYSCAVEMILKLWRPEDYAKVRSMTLESQMQVVKALASLDCANSCIEVPSGLTAADVQAWISSVTKTTCVVSSLEFVFCWRNATVLPEIRPL